MHYVYIIYSPSFDRYYIGESINAVERTIQHNTGHYHGASTSYTNDWILELTLEVSSETEALRIERYIKSMKSKVFIKQLIKAPGFLNAFKQTIKQKFDIDIK